MSEEERKANGEVVRLPSSLSDGLEALKKDQEWADKALGKEFVSLYLQIKEFEIETESEKGEQERRAQLIQTF